MSNKRRMKEKSYGPSGSGLLHKEWNISVKRKDELIYKTGLPCILFFFFSSWIDATSKASSQTTVIRKARFEMELCTSICHGLFEQTKIKEPDSLFVQNLLQIVLLFQPQASLCPFLPKTEAICFCFPVHFLWIFRIPSRFESRHSIFTQSIKNIYCALLSD